jgi:hypothetical protein
VNVARKGRNKEVRFSCACSKVACAAWAFSRLGNAEKDLPAAKAARPGERARASQFKPGLSRRSPRRRSDKLKVMAKGDGLVLEKKYNAAAGVFIRG